MRSACRTVENRCDMRIVVQRCVAARIALEDLGLATHVELRGGLVEQHHAGAARETAHNARASAMRCHWPPDRSVPPS